MVADAFQTNLAQIFTRLQKVHEQLSSGKRIRRGSDDPPAVIQAVSLRSTLQMNDQFLRTINLSKTWLETSESAMGIMTDVLARARELAVQGANGALNAGDRRAIAMEVDQLLGSAVAAGNTSSSGAYLFAGHRITTTPFSIAIAPTVGAIALSDSSSEPATVSGAYTGTTTRDFVVEVVTAGGDAGGTQAITSIKVSTDGGATFGAPIAVAADSASIGNGLTINFTAPGTTTNAGDRYSFSAYPTGAVMYNGDNGQMPREIGAKLLLSINVTGQRSDASLRSVFQTLVQLRDDLNANSQSAISADVGAVDTAMDTVLKLRAEAGAKVNRFNFTEQRLLDVQIDLKRLLTETEDVDMAETITKFQLEESVYQAALNAGARAIQPSLLDFMR